MILPQVKIRKILYATDLSENARYAFAYAVNLANTYKAELTILHVISEMPAIEESIVGYVGAEQWKRIKEQNIEDARNILIGKKRENVGIREILGIFAQNAKSILDADATLTDEIVIEKGNPVDKIIEVCDKRDCDLIVMGSHGHGAIADVVMGSTARRVLRRAKVPVLMVRLPEED